MNLNLQTAEIGTKVRRLRKYDDGKDGHTFRITGILNRGPVTSVAYLIDLDDLPVRTNWSWEYLANLEPVE